MRVRTSQDTQSYTLYLLGDGTVSSAPSFDAEGAPTGAGGALRASASAGEAPAGVGGSPQAGASAEEAAEATACAPIAITVTRKRVRNLNLRVRRDGNVALSTPLHTTPERAQAFVRERAGWIRAHVTRVQERAQVAEQPQATYPLWGKLVSVPRQDALSRAELDELYRREVSRELPAIVMYMEGMVGAHATAWQLRAMTSRWGSCTPKTGKIRINVRLAAYPMECLCYVVVHELAHLLEPSHNARFHAVVARAVPNEPEIRARLRRPPADPSST